jgi:trans-2-enoyl-CoA reductase
LKRKSSNAINHKSFSRETIDEVVEKMKKYFPNITIITLLSAHSPGAHYKVKNMKQKRVKEEK